MTTNQIDNVSPQEFIGMIAATMGVGQGLTDDYAQKMQRRMAQIESMRQEASERAAQGINQQLQAADGIAKSEAWRIARQHAQQRLAEYGAALQAAGRYEYTGSPTNALIFQSLVELHRLGSLHAFTPAELAQLGEQING